VTFVVVDEFEPLLLLLFPFWFSIFCLTFLGGGLTFQGVTSHFLNACIKQKIYLKNKREQTRIKFKKIWANTIPFIQSLNFFVNSISSKISLNRSGSSMTRAIKFRAIVIALLIVVSLRSSMFITYIFCMNVSYNLTRLVSQFFIYCMPGHLNHTPKKHIVVFPPKEIPIIQYNQIIWTFKLTHRNLLYVLIHYKKYRFWQRQCRCQKHKVAAYRWEKCCCEMLCKDN
jgi:hypothetical protein